MLTPFLILLKLSRLLGNFRKVLHAFKGYNRTCTRNLAVEIRSSRILIWYHPKNTDAKRDCTEQMPTYKAALKAEQAPTVSVHKLL